MIVVDSSALIAILLDEPDKQAFLNVIAGDTRCVISAVNARETATVLRARRGRAVVRRFWQLLADSEIEIVSFDEEQEHRAAAAFDRYGKRMKSKAQLNLSDCAAYALAKLLGAPLLFKGGDFTQTDLESCL